MIPDFYGTHSGVQITALLLGIAALILGRKLFWLTVAILGFMFGLALVAHFIGTHPSEGVVLVSGLVLGVIGAILATMLQKLIINLAGFLIGGYFALWLISTFHIGSYQWIFFLAGGLIGYLIIQSLFETALIIISSLVGALLIVQLVHLNPALTGLLFFILMLAGIFYQTRTLRQEQRI